MGFHGNNDILKFKSCTSSIVVSTKGFSIGDFSERSLVSRTLATVTPGYGSIVFVCIFDTEVVDHKGEGNVSCVMEKESFSTGCFVVSKLFQVCDQIIMCYFPPLFEAITCLFYPCIDIAVTDEFL